ncbi:MAG TPA: hypothetical protein VEH83_01310 [Gemmatimonadales bacterium]|nr:hypothetical protein [Gemmatimonadales bacterium]
MRRPEPPAPAPDAAARPADALHARAMDDLRYIRATMESAASFTALSGWGGAIIGLTAFPAAYLASRVPTHKMWMRVWLVEALIGVLIGVGMTVRKARRAGQPLFGRPGRKFALTFATPLAAGAILTIPLYYGGNTAILPGTWLLLYGTAFATAGAFSVSAVPVMGLSFMVVGTAALAAPAAWGDLLMAAGFGVLHVVFGALIARKHGG